MANNRVWVPAALTLAGVACGFVTLIRMAEGRYVAGMLWMSAAVVFDGIDGKVATLLDCKSELGAKLDSLADVVSFAVVPGVCAYLFFQRAPYAGAWQTVAAWVGGIGYTCAGIFREVRFLAFQTDRTRQEGFVGLPIAPPASLNVALLALASVYPRAFQSAAIQGLVFGVIALDVWLMTGSRIQYLRWSARGIAVQTVLAAAAGIATQVASGSAAGGLGVFWATFCAIYIAYHPLRALVRSRAGSA